MSNKKILFTAYDLNIGGIESSLLNLLKKFNYDKYEVHLLLEKKEGIWLSSIPDKVIVEEYTPFSSGNVFIRKAKNFIKYLFWKRKNNKKYDFSCSFATYSKVGAKLALTASRNSHIWVHSDYTKIYNERDLNKFFDGISFRKFKRRIFVSNESMINILNIYKIKNNNYVVYNVIDYEEMIKKSSRKINDMKIKRTTFLNVCRHDDSSKKLCRLFNACKKLKKEGYFFDLFLVGDGNDSSFYKEYVKENNLFDVVHFLGSKSNPYPYYKKADAIVLSSLYEGYGMVILEAMLFNKPVISTNVSDWKDYGNQYGIFVNNDDDSIYDGLKEFLDNGFVIKQKYDYREHNRKIMNQIEGFIRNSV